MWWWSLSWPEKTLALNFQRWNDYVARWNSKAERNSSGNKPHEQEMPTVCIWQDKCLYFKWNGSLSCWVLESVFSSWSWPDYEVFAIFQSSVKLESHTGLGTNIDLAELSWEYEEILQLDNINVLLTMTCHLVHFLSYSMKTEMWQHSWHIS